MNRANKIAKTESAVSAGNDKMLVLRIPAFIIKPSRAKIGSFKPLARNDLYIFRSIFFAGSQGSTLSSYQELIQQIENLQKKAEEARKKELNEVIAEINEKIAAYGLRASDLKFGAAVSTAPSRQSRKQVAAKYRDPQSGKTWSGRGRLPLWLTEAESAGRTRDQFLIG